jgi:hypothetical protein
MKAAVFSVAPYRSNNRPPAPANPETGSIAGDAEATTTATVNDSGHSVMFTLPTANGHPRVWRWAGGQPVPLPAPGAFSAQPAW